MLLSIYDQSLRYHSFYTCFSKHGYLIGKKCDLIGGIEIPDWLTHSLIGWITSKPTKLDAGLLVIGSLIPDISKISLVFSLFNKNYAYFLNPIHTPIGALLIAVLFALFFHNIKKAFIPLIIGIATHFILDLFLLNVSGGMPFVFPFSWDEWQLNLIRSDDYSMTILAVLAALVIYIIYFYYEKRKSKFKRET